MTSTPTAVTNNLLVTSMPGAVTIYKNTNLGRPMSIRHTSDGWNTLIGTVSYTLILSNIVTYLLSYLGLTIGANGWNNHIYMRLIPFRFNYTVTDDKWSVLLVDNCIQL